MNRSIPEILIGVILAAIATFVVADLAGGFGDFPNERWAALICAVCLLIWIGPRLLYRYAGQGSMVLRHIALWLAIICAVALLYVYGKDFLVSIGVNVP